MSKVDALSVVILILLVAAYAVMFVGGYIR